MEHLSTVAQEVFLPVITNPRNQHGWPEVITKEVMENMHKFIASVYVTIGQTKGKTLLPMPPSESSSSGGADGASTTDQIHVLESAIVTWTRQIKGVLKTDPEQALNRDDGEHPGPLTELEFWEDKAANLNAIHEQLSGPKIRKVVTVLDVAKSSYFPAFQKLCKEVAHARVEANDNLLFLKPLDKYFTKLQNNQDEFEGLVELFKPIMHLVMLVWKHSHHYNTPGRIVVLMRQICNDLIMQSQKFLPGGEIFGLEPPEAVEKLKLLLNVLGSFKSFYFEYKGRTTRDTPQNPWKFQNSALFARLDAFLERCHDILDLTQTALQFNKLERVEVGGTKGKALSANVRQIHADFEEALEKLHQVEYDVMDVESKHFDDDFYEFRTCIKELERRLGSVIIQGFEDCVTVGTAFKLFDSFEGLLEREIIMADLEKKQMELVRFFGTDLKEVEAIFHGQRDKPVVGKNLPPCSGAVKWVRALHERVKDPMEKLTSLNKLVMETDESREVTELFERVGAQFEEYETEVLASWAKEVDATGEEKLKLNLLAYDEQAEIPGILRVNFDPKLVKLLRETKYFMLLDANVPASARKIYERNETLRQQTGNLDLIVGTFNNILRTLLPVERPLVAEKIEKIEEMLQKAITTLNWNSHKINDYLAEVMTAVKELDTILNYLKNSVEKTQNVLRQWEENLMIDRKDGKTYAVDEFSEMQQKLQAERDEKIADGGVEITKFLQMSNKKVAVPRASKAWREYVEYVNEIVMEVRRVSFIFVSFISVRAIILTTCFICCYRATQTPSSRRSSTSTSRSTPKSSPRRNRRLYWKSASSSWCRTSSGPQRLARAAMPIDPASAT